MVVAGGFCAPALPFLILTTTSRSLPLVTTTASSILPFEHFGSLSRCSVGCVGGSPSNNTVPLIEPVVLGSAEAAEAASKIRTNAREIMGVGPTRYRDHSPFACGFGTLQLRLCSQRGRSARETRGDGRDTAGIAVPRSRRAWPLAAHRR